MNSTKFSDPLFEKDRYRLMNYGIDDPCNSENSSNNGAYID